MATDSRRDRANSGPAPTEHGKPRTAQEAVTREAKQLIRKLDERYSEQHSDNAAGKRRTVKLGGPGHFGGGELDDASH